MEYEKYLDYFSGNREHIIQLADKAGRVKRTWQEVQTDFLSPDEQHILKRICRDEGLNVCFFGGRGDFERAAAIISMEEYSGEIPVDVLKISGNFKFEKLTHRDYLGAVLSLGIKREKFGDINVYEDGAEIFVQKDISDYILLNLTKIKHTGIKIQRIDYSMAREKAQQFKEKPIIVTSLRLDCIIAAAVDASRLAAASLVKSGDVKVNYSVTNDVSCRINEGDLISVKGFGRFIIGEVTGTTKRDRITLKIRKYM